MNNMARNFMSIVHFLTVSCACCMAADITEPAGAGRQVVSLDGQWQITQGDYTTVPKASDFDRTVPVPGLADMAQPAFRHVGYAEESKTLRDCFWYDIADEEGFLIQDEYAEWQFQEQNDVEIMIDEFRAWMHQRWNHPSVVIWDAQNESHTYGQIPYIVSRVRGEDLSNRPWNMGWDGVARSTDPHESHYYPYGGWKKGNYPHISECVKRYSYRERTVGQPVIVNEYGSFWVNRDGSETYLSKRSFDEVIGRGHSKEQRQLTSALYVSMLTEAFRRSVRGGVMHFVGLAYSTPGGNQQTGATSDSLCQLNPPKFDPYFEKYVKDSFSRVAMTLDIWEQEVKPGANFKAPLLLHNDSAEVWTGEITVFLYNGDHVIHEVSQTSEVNPYSKKELLFDGFVAPREGGVYRVEAELFYKDESVRSRRRIYVTEAK